MSECRNNSEVLKLSFLCSDKPYDANDIWKYKLVRTGESIKRNALLHYNGTKTVTINGQKLILKHKR